MVSKIISPQLAVVIPTYRWDGRAKETLTQAAAMGSDEIVVHIGDNSANPEKHSFLKDLAERSTNVNVSCHASNIGADSNWLHLVKAQSAPYICMAADDDSYVAGYFKAGLALVRDDPDCATASGLHLCVAHTAPNKTSEVSTPSQRLEATPIKRIANYRGQNSICYAISPLSVIQGFANYVEVNPLQCPFNDYMLAFHLLSMGTYRMNNRGYAYIYDNSNWQLNDAFIASNGRWYRGYDLPETFAYLTRLHWAVVAVHFFLSNFRASNLTSAQALEISSYLFERQRREFLGDFRLYKKNIKSIFNHDPSTFAVLRKLMLDRYDRIEAIFDDFQVVVSMFSPTVASRYRAFQTSTLYPDAGPIDGRAIGRTAKVKSFARRLANRPNG